MSYRSNRSKLTFDRASSFETKHIIYNSSNKKVWISKKKMLVSERSNTLNIAKENLDKKEEETNKMYLKR